MIQHDIAKAIAAMPGGIEPELSMQTRALYAPHHVGLSAGITSETDIAYGPHARHRLDIYARTGAKHDAIVIYVPGGGFTGGDKRAFGNIGCYLARNGVLGLTMNYRLAPEVRWPAGAEDVAAAVAWAKASAASYDANASRVVVFGHSAGGSHCATYLLDPDFRGHASVAGGILVSGASYTLAKDRVRGGSLAYFGEDDSTYLRRSVTTHVPGTKVPVMLAFAERDPDFLVMPTLHMAMTLTLRDGRCPPLYRLEGHNHFSPPSSLGTSDDELGAAILRFVGAV